MCRQAIKLRKLESLNTNNGPTTTTTNNTTAGGGGGGGVADLSTIFETVDLNQHHLNDTSMFMSASAFLQHNETTTTTTTSSNPRTSLGGVYVDYFVTYDEKSPRLSSESSGQATRRSTMAYPGLSQSMRLADFKFWDALIHVGALNLIYSSIQDARGVVSAGFVPGQTITRLDDALEWFNIMDAEESNQQPAREYTKYELEVTSIQEKWNLLMFLNFLY